MTATITIIRMRRAMEVPPCKCVVHSFTIEEENKFHFFIKNKEKIMNFIELFSMQRKLDAFIENNRGINSDVFIEKGLALTVELAELANETRCFKYWSSKGTSEKAILLEEFVDSIHFLLSLGNEKGISIDEWPEIEIHEEVNLSKLFLKTQQSILTYIQHPEVDKYNIVWQNYSVLAYNLGFTLEDILVAYKLKNEKNYERQRTGY